MKLSSAFDSPLILNGCTGKTSIVPNEVVAITGDQMSYLNKSNEMKLIENKEDMSDITWSGVFNLSDKDGVNTIAYGSNGAIYGCYNYDNLNVASYSRSYSGNEINMSAYAVGEVAETATGVMLGASKDEIFIYSEGVTFEGTKTQSWTPAEFNEEDRSSTNYFDASKDSLVVYNLISAGQTFFIATNQGLIAFDASGISSPKISSWINISEFPPADILDGDSSLKDTILQNIQFIREKTFKFPDNGTIVGPSIKAFVIAWNINGNTSACLLQQTGTSWKCISMMKNEKCQLADIFPLNGISFPNDIKTAPQSYSTINPNEDIPWIDPSAISILPERKIDESWSRPIRSPNSISDLGEETSSLKMKTQTGHMILARNAVSSGSQKIENAPSAENFNDQNSPNIYSYDSAIDKWRFEAPLTILARDEPLPTHLENQGIYWIAKTPQNEGGFFSKWNEDYEVRKNGTNEPEPLNLSSDPDFILPDNSVQLFNDRTNNIVLKFDISKIFQHSSFKNKVLIRPIVGIERSVSESFNVQFFDIIRKCYVRWNPDNESWVISSSPMSGYSTVSIDGIFDFIESSRPSAIPFDVAVSYSNLAVPEVLSTYFGDNGHLSASLKINEDNENIIELHIQLNKPSSDFFDKNIKFRLVLELEEKNDLDFSKEREISFNDSQENPHRIYALKLIKPADPDTEENDEIKYAILHLNSSGSPERIEIKDTFSITLSDDDSDVEDSIFNYLESTFQVSQIEVEEFPSETNIYFKIPSSSKPYHVQYYINSRNVVAIEPQITLSSLQYVEDELDPWKFEVETASSPQHVEKRFLYSKSGLLSETNDGQIVGNEIKCSLQFANGKSSYRFSISSFNAQMLESLVPLDSYTGTVLECIHTFKDINGELNPHPFPAGTVFLSRNSEDKSYLAFSKTVNGSSLEIKGIPAGEELSNSEPFTPKMNNGLDNFVAEIPCIKKISDDESLNVTISVSIDKAYVVDRKDWIGEYSEYFNQCKVVNEDELHYISIDSNNGILFSRSDFAYDGNIPILFSSIKSVQTLIDNQLLPVLAFENENTSGCKVQIESNAIPEHWNTIPYKITTTPYILGSSTVWKIASGNENQLVVEKSDSCLNFSAHENFHISEIYYDEETEQNITSLKTISVSLHDIPVTSDPDNSDPDNSDPDNSTESENILSEKQWRLNIATEIISESILDEFSKDSTWINFALNNGTCIWIKELVEEEEELRLYVLNTEDEVVEDDESVSYGLHLASQEHEWNEKDIYELSFGILIKYSDLYRLIQLKHDSETLTETIEESLEDIMPIQHIDVQDLLDFKYAVVSGNLAYSLSLHFIEDDAGLSISSGTFSPAVNEGSYFDAVKNGLIYITSKDGVISCRNFSPSMSEQGQYEFSSTVVQAHLPYIQYSTIKQLNYSIPRKLIRWKTSFANNAFEMLEELQNADANGNYWKNIEDYRYDSSKAYEIRSDDVWPEFNPEIGKIYYVTENHLTENTAATKYSTGRYIYIRHGDTLKDSYRKLPQLDTSLIDPSSNAPNWTHWVNSIFQTYAMAIGTVASTGESFAKIARLEYDTVNFINIIKITESLDAKKAGTFILNNEMVQPFSKCEFTAINDGLSSEQQIYVGIQIGTSTKIAVPVYQKFSIPRISGLFVLDQEPLFCLTGPIVDIVSSEENSQSIEVIPLQNKLDIPEGKTSILSMTTRQDARSTASKTPVWLWEISLYPYLDSGSYVIGAVGRTTIYIGSSGSIETSIAKKYVYTKTLTRGTIATGLVQGGAFPKICSPTEDYVDDNSSRNALSEIVYYDDFGFHVHVPGHGSTEDSTVPFEIVGTDQMSSISTIKLMKTFKAYNAPIVVGLYEKGGLILYYGSKTFDRSILGKKRFNYANPEFDSNGSYLVTKEEETSENSFAVYMKNQIDAAYALKSYTANILSQYFRANPEEVNASPVIKKIEVKIINENGTVSSQLKNLDDYMIEQYASDILTTTALKNDFKRALKEDIIYGPRDDEALSEMNANVVKALKRIEMRVIAQEEKSRLEKDSDDKLISSYEYSVNNSTDSQWINIPIYVKSGNAYKEVDEELSTLSSSVVNGRIRLTVGSMSGNVYWRDLNPLHADRYLSYIPTGLLSDAEKSTVMETVIDSGNESLKKFLDGNSSESSEQQTVKIGWTSIKWKYNGNSSINDETEFTAYAGSKCTLKKANSETIKSQKWLIANGTLQNVKLTNEQAEAVESTTSYNPYVFKRSSKWIVGGEETSISVYANEPEVKMNGNSLVWYFNNHSTSIAAVPGKYPEIINSNGTEKWTIDGTVLGDAILNGRPFIQDDAWIINEYGKSKPTKIFDLKPNSITVQTIVKGSFIDSWAINGIDIKYTTPSEITSSVKFGVGYKSYWTFSNVLNPETNTQASLLQTSYVDKECPFNLEPERLVIVDTDELHEAPIWTSTSSQNSSFINFNKNVIEMDLFYLKEDSRSKKWRLMAVEDNEEHYLEFNASDSSTSDPGHLSYYITLSGKEWWLLPKEWWKLERDGRNEEYYIKESYEQPIERIGPYVSETSPHSSVGSEWKFVDVKNKQRVEYWSKKDIPPDASVEIGERGQWIIDEVDTGYMSNEWTLPKFNSSLWYWSFDTAPEKIYITRTAECPFIKRPEYCLWENGWTIQNTRNRSVQNISVDDFNMTVEESASRYHWYVDGRDSGVQCDENSTHSVKLESVNGKLQFVWLVPEYPETVDSLGNPVMREIAATSSCICPLTKNKALSWWINSNGTKIETPVDVKDPLESKGLEKNGIAARMFSETVWNEDTNSWEKTDPKWTSWTPLASLFVDAYKEVSYGMLESITDPWSVSNPDIMKEGMAWEVKTSNEIFGEDGVHISDEQNNSWDTYKEKEGSGNEEFPSFIVYIGWKKNEEFYDSFCTIESLSTGSKVRWKVKRKPYRFEHLELVKNLDGTLANIVILASQGWIVSLKQFSLTNGGKDIHALVWNDPSNPVQEVLPEIEKIEAFKWNSWDSNYRMEFTAVGSFGVHVYSEDCQRFEASIPYGEDSELLEVHHNKETDSFDIRGTGKEADSTTPSQAQSQQTDSDFESEYESGAVNSSQSSSISVSTLEPFTLLYKHQHKTWDKVQETLYYAFSSATTSFIQIDSPSEEQKKNAIGITADLTYRYSANGKTWSFIYSKCDAKTKERLGSGYYGNSQWIWMWTRIEVDDSEPKNLAYITISKNTNSVAYGFPDLKRFIHSYKQLYSDSMEFVGSVCQFATADRDSININGVSLKQVYDELAALDGFDIYSSHLATAWRIFLQAKELRDKSHYLPNDCYNTYLSRIGQSLALEEKDYFTKAKNAMWTAQAFAKYYSDMIAKGTGK